MAQKPAHGKRSRGSELLMQQAEKLHDEHERGGKAEVARRLGRPLYSISKWLTGDRRPTPQDRAVIEDVLGIDWRAWDEPPDIDDASVEEPAA